MWYLEIIVPRLFRCQQKHHLKKIRIHSFSERITHLLKNGDHLSDLGCVLHDLRRNQSKYELNCILEGPNILIPWFLILSMSVIEILHVVETLILQSFSDTVIYRITILYIIPVFNSYRCLQNNDKEGIKKLIRFW